MNDLGGCVYFIYIYHPRTYLKPTRDRPLTQVPPLCSPANARFVDVLSLSSPILSRYFRLLSYCFLVLSLYFLILSLNYFLLVNYYYVLISLNESVQSACFEC